MARHGPHQVAQKSTSTGLSDFKTSWSKFASVTSTIPLPAIFFLLAVTSFCRRTLHRAGVPGPVCLPKCSHKRGELNYRSTSDWMHETRSKSQKRPAVKESGKRFTGA